MNAKKQEVDQNMKRSLIWILSALILSGLLGVASAGLAVEDTWTEKGDMPTARAYLSASAVNGKIYAIGGTQGDPTGWGGMPTVEEYDPSTDTWTKKADMPTARQSLSTSVVNGKIYGIGGIRTWAIPLSTVEEYDPATDTWTQRADMPMARFGLSASVVNGRIYAIGGTLAWPAVPLSTVEEYDTGFVPLQLAGNVDAKEKLAAMWGKIRSD